MYKAMLNLINTVQVRKSVETSDGMGGVTTTTTITTLSRANIWQPGSGDSFLSDKIAKTSSHVMAVIPGEYAFSTTSPEQVLYDGNTYKVTGHSDNVANRDKVMIIGLERIT